MKTYKERIADVAARIQKKKDRTVILTGTALTMVIVLVLSLVLFLPFHSGAPDVSRYADSPYYSVIQKINEATYTPPRYNNNFEILMGTLSNGVRDFVSGGTSLKGEIWDGSPEFSLPLGGNDWYEIPVEDAIPEMAPGGVAEPNEGYVEVTDNQVQGVIESDIFKRSSEYVYYLRGSQLSVYSIAGEASALVGEYTVQGVKEQTKIDEFGDFGYYNNVEMYLSADCRTVTVVMDAYFKTIGTSTLLVSLDVSDPANITETDRLYITGSYLSSRMVDGKILLMSKFRVQSDQDFSDESTFLPQVGTPGNMTSIAADDILAPDTLSNVYYTVVCSVDGSTLELNDSAAFLSYSDDIYVSAENIFASRSYTEKTENGGSRTLTEISCLNYAGETLEYLGSVTVAGTIKDQYSMDEYEGILRVVTSTSETVSQTDGDWAWAQTQQNASLYCVSLEDFSIVASVEKFAPDNETAESVRFDGPMAYVCTAEVITFTDPVYFFDLSDLQNITWTDTGTIDGYSTSLINMGDGFLLGIGYGDRRNLKIEVYEEHDGSVISVCAYELNADFAEVYKSYLVDRENDLIGLAVCDWYTAELDYVLLHFDGYALHEIVRTPIYGAMGDTRAFLADGWLYILGSTPEDFHVLNVW